MAYGAILCYSLLSCRIFQGLLNNVDDSSGGLPLGAAFLSPLPTPALRFLVSAFFTWP